MSESGPRRLHPSTLPWVVLAVSLALAAVATLLVGRSVYERDQARFANATAAAQDRITGRLEVYLTTLRGGAGLFAADDSVTREEFHAYVDRLDLTRRYPGVQGIGWSQRVGTGLSGPADERHAIRYLFPMDERNRAAIGFDMYSEPVRREAMSRARDLGEPALSGSVILVQEIYGRRQPGFLLYLPVFRGAAVPRSVMERRERLLGYVYAPFRVDDFFAGIFGTEEEPRVSFSVYDGRELSPATLLHASPGADGGTPEFEGVRRVTIAGREWTVVYRSRAVFERTSGRFLTPVTAASGVLISLILFVLARLQARARVAAERANRAKSAFLATMSHELRTPLNAIAGYVEILALGIRGPVNEAQKHDLERIRRAQHHLLGLINDVLNFAKLEAGRVDMQIEEVVLSQVAGESESLVMPQLRARALTLTRRPSDPAVRVLADREKLRQVLLNLLSNAVKFTDPGGTIELGWEAHGPDVALEVRDTGIGIPADQLESVFDPFVQVDSDLTRTRQGTGLGLAISRALAREMGGDLTARSTPGEGSTFCVRLPRAEAAG